MGETPRESGGNTVERRLAFKLFFLFAFDKADEALAFIHSSTTDQGLSRCPTLVLLLVLPLRSFFGFTALTWFMFILRFRL